MAALLELLEPEFLCYKLGTMETFIQSGYAKSKNPSYSLSEVNSHYLSDVKPILRHITLSQNINNVQMMLNSRLHLVVQGISSLAPGI